MNDFWIEELRNKCNEIFRNTVDSDMVTKVIKAYNRILETSHIARRGGLLFLEEYGEKLDRNDVTQDYFHTLLYSIVEGTDAELLTRIGINKCISMGLPSYDGLILLIYLQGSLMIQEGDNTRLIDEVIKSMLPKVILDELNEMKGASYMEVQWT